MTYIMSLVLKSCISDFSVFVTLLIGPNGLCQALLHAMAIGNQLRRSGFLSPSLSVKV